MIQKKKKQGSQVQKQTKGDKSKVATKAKTAKQGANKKQSSNKKCKTQNPKNTYHWEAGDILYKETLGT